MAGRVRFGRRLMGLSLIGVVAAACLALAAPEPISRLAEIQRRGTLTVLIRPE